MTASITSCTSRRSKLNPETIRRLTIVACATLLVVPVLLKSRTSRNESAPAAFHMVSGNRVYVKVSGDVRQAGVYEVSANEMAIGVIKMAQPLRPIPKDVNEQADRLPLKNGLAITVLSGSEGVQQLTAGNMTVPELLILKIPLDISTMSDADFECIPGIGPALAVRIGEYRQNNGGELRVEDLANVAGIGEKKLALIRSYFQPAVNTQ